MSRFTYPIAKKKIGRKEMEEVREKFSEEKIYGDCNPHILL
jgi:hypothetical protein